MEGARKKSMGSAGTTSFTAVAIVILMLSVFAAAYLGSVERTATTRAQVSVRTLRLENAAASTASEVGDHIYIKACDAIFRDTQLGEGDMNSILDGYLGEIKDKYGSITTRATEIRLNTVDGEIKEKGGQVYDPSTGTFINASTGYTISWSIKAVAKDRESGISLERWFNGSRDIDSPYPLMKSSVGQFLTDINEGGRLFELTEAALSDLAQYRILKGQGMSSASETENIITPLEVEVVFNLVLYLLIIEDLGIVDTTLEKVIESKCGRPIEPIRKSFHQYGRIDVTDMVALLEGLDSQEIELKTIITQALYTVADQIALKLIDYFLFAEKLLDLVDKAISTVKEFGEEVKNFFSDEDKEDRTYNAVKEELDRASGYGLDSTLWDGNNYYILHSAGTYWLKNSYSVEAEESYISSVEVPKDDNDNYVVTTTTVNMVLTVESGYYPIDFESKKLDKSFWEDFDASKYATSASDKISEAIKDILEDIATAITSNMGPIRLDNIDPTDETPFMKSLANKIEISLEKVTENLKNEGASLAEKLKDVLSLFSENVNEIASYISDKYDSYAGVVNGGSLTGDGGGLIDNVIESMLEKSTYEKEISTTSEELPEGEVGGKKPQTEEFNEGDMKAKLKEELKKKINEEEEDNIKSVIISEYSKIKEKEIKSYSKALEKSVTDDTDPMDILTGIKIGKKSFGIADVIIDFVSAIVKNIVDSMTYIRPGMHTVYREGVEVRDSPKTEAYTVSFQYKQIPAYVPIDVDMNRRGAEGDMRRDIRATHYTSLLNFNTRPYEYTWNIHIKGGFIARLSSSVYDILGNTPHRTWYNTTVSLDRRMHVTAYAGWKLAGTNPVSTSTLGEDVWNAIVNFISTLWGKIKEFVGTAIEKAKEVLEFLSSAMKYLMSQSQKAMETFSRIVVKAIEMLQNAIMPYVGEVMSIINTIKGYFESGKSFTLWGMDFNIHLGDTDSLAGASTDFVMDVMPRDDMKLSFHFLIDCEIVSAMKEGSDKLIKYFAPLVFFQMGEVDKPWLKAKFDILRFTDNFMFSGTYTDPHGNYKLDFHLPEKEEPKDTKWLSLTPVPIPIPPLGIQAEVSIGYYLDWDYPISDHVVINELGYDNKNEKYIVELYNPTGHTVHINEGKLVPQFNTPSTKIFTYELPSGNRYCVEVPVLPHLEGFASDLNYLGMFLIDNNGNIVDAVLFKKFVTDMSYQRSYDGGHSWIAAEPTYEHPNSDEKPEWDRKQMEQLIVSLLQESIMETFNEMSENARPDLGYVVDVVRCFIDNTIENVIETLKSIIQEVGVLLDFRFTAMGAVEGPGAGLKLSFKVCGDTIVEFFLWLVKVIAHYIQSIAGIPSGDIPALSEDAMENIWVSVIIYGESTVEGEGQGIAAAFSMNIPFLAWATGRPIDGEKIMTVKVKAYGNTKPLEKILFPKDKDQDENSDILLLVVHCQILDKNENGDA